MSGREETHLRALSLMKGKAAVANDDEFKECLAFVGTRDLFGRKKQFLSGQAYFWISSAETYCLIGAAIEKAMLNLVEEKE